jgi:hypothetical protein
VCKQLGVDISWLYKEVNMIWLLRKKERLPLYSKQGVELLMKMPLGS